MYEAASSASSDIETEVSDGRWLAVCGEIFVGLLICEAICNR